MGDIKGATVSANAKTVYNFNGLPYAEPPVGSLRFRPSTLKTSKWSGTLDGTKPGAQCLQPNFLANRAEDCLFLNVFTTKSIVENTKHKLVPVLFWIYGGGFTIGAGSEIPYDGTHLITQHKDVVLVTFNYRLGALGFLNNVQLCGEDPIDNSERTAEPMPSVKAKRC